ncbi:MAG TPA: NAD-binding protein, partial [Spirochaetota bacterium]|nr:NAD-binding protein [Spirochaetota bacterium]
MNVIVLGAGDFGVEVAETFVQKGHNVTVLDKDPLRIDYITDNIDVFSIKGYGLNAEELEKAEINKADVFIATTASDESNILSSYLAKKKNPALKTAARIRYFNINGYPNLNYNDFGV